MAPTLRTATGSRESRREREQRPENPITKANEVVPPTSKQAEPEFEPFEKFSSDVVSETKQIMWELKNFKVLSQMSDSFKTMKIHVEAGKTIGIPTKWCFFLRRDDDELGLYLRLSEARTKDKEIFVQYDTSIKRPTSNGGSITSTTPNLIRLSTEIVDMKAVADWGWNNLYSIAALVSSKNHNLVKDALVIELKFTIYARNTVSRKETMMEVDKLQNRCLSALNEDLRSLLEKGTAADVTFEMKDGQKFSAHKAILGVRSPVFLAMFESSMREKATGVVKVDDVNSETMKMILEFIYTANLKPNWTDYSDELIYAADKYSLSLLKEFCDKTLSSNCTTENAFNLLRLARLHTLDIAVNEINDYIKSNVTAVLQNLP